MMFDHFTFGPQALPTVSEERIISTSPTDTSFPSPISENQLSSLPPWSPYPQDPVDGIVHKFSQHSLQHHEDELPQHSVWNADESLPSPDFDLDDDFTPDQFSYVSTTRGMATVPVPTSTQSLPDLPALPQPQGALACRRMQRQLNAQLQASSSHIRDLNALLEEMIVTNSQCTLHQSTSRPYLSSPPPSRAGTEELVPDTNEVSTQRMNMFDEDEGFSEIADEDWGPEEEMTLRRASTPSGIRKYGLIRWRGSAEIVAPVNTAGRMKVRSVPRMRRRKPKSVPE
jgi:hypothetical protein